MIRKSTDGKQRVLSLSYGKDSMACLGALDLLGLPLDRIVTADVWATDTIPADLPPMVEFKAKADAIIKERYGISVEHFYATNKDGTKRTYNCRFFAPYFHTCEKIMKNSLGANGIYGFPSRGKNWCNSQLKIAAINKSAKETRGVVRYIGIASDEPNRFHVLSESKVSPLVKIGWTEEDAKRWCIENDLLSPIYTDSARGGCWFCHNQGVNQLRLLRKNYPELWALLLKWDNDSPVAFNPDGHTVHDFDRRFRMEDDGWLLPYDRTFRWSMLSDDVQMKFF